MAKLSAHQSSRYAKILYIGDCLTGDTVVSVTRGNSKSKDKTLLDLWKRFNGMSGDRQWNPELETYLLSDVGGYVGLNKMEGIVHSGAKEVFEVSAGGRLIRASANHKFLTEDGWQTLETLSGAHKVLMWRSSRTVEERKRARGSPSFGRAVVYSIPYHPFATNNWVEGFNYKRTNKARLVVEAAYNNMSVEELIQILRKDKERALTLRYIPQDFVVHHLDGDWTNDSLKNLQVLSKEEHDFHHHDAKVKASKALVAHSVLDIRPVGVRETFDLFMESPHNNFIANGFVVHNSGTGKTGSLVSLVKDGYKLKIIDLDNGLSALRGFVKHECPDKIDNVDYETVKDIYTSSNDGPKITAKAMVEATKLLTKWTDDSDPAKGDENSVVVLDSLTALGKSAFEWAKKMNPTSKDPRQWYGAAQPVIENIIGMLTSDEFESNVVVISHINYQEYQDGTTKGFPQSIGKALGPTIPKYFDTLVMAGKKGTGTNLKRTIATMPTALIDLKNPSPFVIESEYDLGTGLAEIFRKLKTLE